MNLLPKLSLAYNTDIKPSTKLALYVLMYARLPKMPMDLIYKRKSVRMYIKNSSKIIGKKNKYTKKFM